MLVDSMSISQTLCKLLPFRSPCDAHPIYCFCSGDINVSCCQARRITQLTGDEFKCMYKMYVLNLCLLWTQGVWNKNAIIRDTYDVPAVRSPTACCENNVITGFISVDHLVISVIRKSTSATFSCRFSVSSLCVASLSSCTRRWSVSFFRCSISL